MPAWLTWQRNALLALSLLAGQQACTKGGPISWPTVVSCAGDVTNLVGKVTSVILNDGGVENLTPGGTKQLEDLGLQFGADAVLCLVDELLREWTAPAATKSPQRSAAARRAEGFMQSTGTRILYVR